MTKVVIKILQGSLVTEIGLGGLTIQLPCYINYLLIYFYVAREQILCLLCMMRFQFVLLPN